MAIGDVLQILPSGLAGFAPIPAPVGSPTFFTRSGVAPANAAGTLNIDLDLTLLGFQDTTVVIEARVIETTKNATPHLTDSAFMPATGVFNNKNSVASLGANAAGTAGNPYNSQPQYINAYPETSDANFRSGGFQPLGATWLLPGGSIVRLVITNPGPVAGDVLVFFAVYPKAA